MAEIGNLGKYELRREIGRGAMGVVYEGYDPMIKRVVALKTIRSDQLDGEESATVIARFRREAQAAGRLSHPNIVPIYDFGEDGGVWFIAMEFVKGRELKEYFEANERFSVPDIVRIMSQMLDALDYSHRQGVIHRDIKPANVFLLDDGSVKVADFGIAHIDSSSLTQVGTVLGTPSYMSPEQIMGLPVDGRSDLFSAGVILYQFLTGERPVCRVRNDDDAEGAEGRSAAAFDAQRPAASRDGCRGAQGACEARRRTLPVGEGIRRARIRAAARQKVDAGTRRRVVIRGRDRVIDRPIQHRSAIRPWRRCKSPRASIRGHRLPPPTMPPVAPTPPEKKSQAPAIAVVVAVAVIAIGAVAWFMVQRGSSDGNKVATAPSPPAAVSAPHRLISDAAPDDTRWQQRCRADPGTMVISAVGLVDPSDPRYQSDKTLLQSDLRADSKSQLVEKALGMLIDTKSMAKNYDLLKDKLLSKSGSFVTTVVRESEPRVGKDGLMSITTQGVVNVKAVQKSLNQMSRDDRVEFIRANGDPKVSVRIMVRDADVPDAPPQPSLVAENILKERIKSFGFRTWSAGSPGG